ncbi:M15 family metallopeptidase [Lewinella cohaerens]|uniref:M15 family metallopeptidase n=1 Tax=Lewinella cohaerens TaxID=70995 RepID=UPI0003A7821F|nr:M15 family metallopeptidase [Lewinella cohaerens]
MEQPNTFLFKNTLRQWMLLALLSTGGLVAACEASPAESDQAETTKAKIMEVAQLDTVVKPPPPPAPDTFDYDTTQWLELIYLDSTIQLDLRYATENNFVGQVMYDCPRCFLRPAAARAVIAAHQELQAEGLGLKMYDCYRPRDVQWKLWEIFPQPGYVADPRKGSIHNRGGAVDLTIVTLKGEELAMGTDFDFFGPKANHTYTDFPEEVLKNRIKLKTLLGKYGFSPIRSEWWHYNFREEKYELADAEWKCPEE